MPEKMLTPKFLTKEIAERAVLRMIDVMRGSEDLLSRQAFHMVILVPSMKDAREKNFPDWPDYNIKPHVIYEHSFAKDVWNHEFDEIARCKALQLWHDRNDDRTDCMPHLLFPSDTPYWGGVKRHGIVVACSGFQAHFDKMFSGIVADICIAMAYNEWDKTKGNFEDDFLP